MHQQTGASVVAEPQLIAAMLSDTGIDVVARHDACRLH
jgi:hypothetical protein